MYVHVFSVLLLSLHVCRPLQVCSGCCSAEIRKGLFSFAVCDFWYLIVPIKSDSAFICFDVLKVH